MKQLPHSFYCIQYSVQLILSVSALLWCFATRRSAPGMVVALPKCCNAVAGYHGDALRVSLSMPMDCVDPLDKGRAPLSARHALP